MNSCQYLLLQVPLLWQCLRGSAGRASGRRRPAGNIIFDTAGRRRAGIGSTHDVRPMPRFLEVTTNSPVVSIHVVDTIRDSYPFECKPHLD